mgnify:CR=1 FL=1
MFKKIYVEWLDAQSGPDGWECLDDNLKPLRSGFCKSIGFLIENGKTSITLCSSVNKDPSRDRKTLVLSRLTIPKRAIIKIQDLDHARA